MKFILTQDEAKRQFEGQLICSATVIRTPKNNKLSDGYEYEIVFYDKDGNQHYILVKQRGAVRKFKSVSAAENVILEIGMRFYSVLMLEYQLDAERYEKLMAHRFNELYDLE